MTATSALLFWAILAVVWVGFNLEFHGFDNLRQPIRGIVLILLTIAISVAITFALSYGWGHFDVSFAANREQGNGYLTGALFVLFGFFTYVMAVVNWGHWPWTKLTTKQPWIGIGEITLLDGAVDPVLCALPALLRAASATRAGHEVDRAPTTTVRRRSWVSRAK